MPMAFATSASCRVSPKNSMFLEGANMASG
jgi:hypothetical protein